MASPCRSAATLPSLWKFQGIPTQTAFETGRTVLLRCSITGQPTAVLGERRPLPGLLSAVAVGVSLLRAGARPSRLRRAGRRCRGVQTTLVEDRPQNAPPLPQESSSQQASSATQPPTATQPEPLAQPLAVLALGFVTVLWGAQHASIKAVLGGADGLEAAVLNLLRFSLAAMCFSPWLPPLPRLDKRPALEWRGGAELGFWLFLGFCLQALGLLYTTAQRSGLLLYLNVKLVPFFAFFLFRRQVPLSAWLSAIAAFTGTLLVAGDGAGGVPPNVGDALSVAAAAASALFILQLEKYAPATDAKALNAVGMLTVAALSLPFALVQAVILAPQEVLAGSPADVAGFACSEAIGRAAGLIKDSSPTLLYLGVVTTAFTSWLQTIGQQSLSATTASAIYALDPLWGCLFAYLWLGEVLGWQGLLGCAVLFAVWLSQLVASMPAGKRRLSSGKESVQDV